MSVLVVGLSHGTAPVSLLDRAALSDVALDKLVRDVYDADHVVESMAVSTCNRVEVYAEVARFHGGVASVSELLAYYCDIPLEQLRSYLYVHYEDRAVQHLFAVAAGLDSMVVGETQILGQVRSSLRHAQRIRTVGRVLDGLVQQALRAGKRAHAETGIDRAGPSLVSVGLERAGAELDGLARRSVVVLGAGSMSALAATTLARAGADVVVANRTARRGSHLAESVGGRAVPLDEVEVELARADAVVCCTGATGSVLSTELISRVLRARRQRDSGFQDSRASPDSRRASHGSDAALFVLDLALPRDVPAEAAEFGGLTLVDLEALRASGADASSAADVEAVRSIVNEEVAAYLSEQRGAQVAPTVVALRTKATEVVEAELARLAGRLPELDERAREEVAQAVRRAVSKLLHAPTVRVKELAGSADGDVYATALRELFDLDPQAPEAVTRADVSVREDSQ